MKRGSFAIHYILVVVVTISPITLAQTVTQNIHDWAAVKALASGSYLDVRLKGDITIYGKLISASDDALRLYISHQTHHFTTQDILDIYKDEVEKIYRIKQKGVLKWSLIGTGIGGAAGAAIGSTMGGCRSNQSPFPNPFPFPNQFPSPNQFPCIDKKSAYMGLLGLAGAGVGGVVGSVIGLRKSRVLVYEL